jgi:hypothetical protein
MASRTQGRNVYELAQRTLNWDYSKFGDDPYQQSAPYTDGKCWGIHLVDSQIHVDRYCAMCKAIGIQDFVPDIFFKNEGKHLEVIPERAHRYDYSVNEFRDLLQVLRTDWNEEYKPVSN